jgi:hypothetical protein
MAKVLRNFKKLHKKVEEFDLIKLRGEEEVLAELPICLCEYGVEYKEPVVMFGQGTFPVCLERKDLEKRIEDTKIFHLKDVKGKVKEVPKEKATVSVRLNKTIDLDQLMFQNNQLVRKPLEPKKEEETKENE